MLATATMLLSLLVVAPRAEAAAAAVVPEVDSCTFYQAGSSFVVDWDAGDATELQTVIYRSVNGSADYWRGRIDTGTQFVDTRRTGVIQYAVATRAANGAKSAPVPCGFGGNINEPIANGPAGDPVPITSCTVETTATSHVVSWVRPDQVAFDHVIYRSVNGSSRYWRARTGPVDKTFTDSRVGGVIDYFVAARASDGDRSIQVACSAANPVQVTPITCSLLNLAEEPFIDGVDFYPRLITTNFVGLREVTRNGVIIESANGGRDDRPIAGPATYRIRSKARVENGQQVPPSNWADCGTATAGSVDSPATCVATYTDGSPSVSWTGGEGMVIKMWRTRPVALLEDPTDYHDIAQPVAADGGPGTGMLIDPVSDEGSVYTYFVGAVPPGGADHNWVGNGAPVGLLECGSLEGTRPVQQGCEFKPGC